MVERIGFDIDGRVYIADHDSKAIAFEVAWFELVVVAGDFQNLDSFPLDLLAAVPLHKWPARRSIVGQRLPQFSSPLYRLRRGDLQAAGNLPLEKLRPHILLFHPQVEMVPCS